MNTITSNSLVFMLVWGLWHYIIVEVQKLLVLFALEIFFVVDEALLSEIDMRIEKEVDR